MIPQLITLRYRRPDHRWRRLYVPVLPLVLLLSPLLILAAIGGVIACVIFRIDALGALRGAGRVFWALPGSRFDLDDGRFGLEVHVI
ncbi:hypothetical protein ACQP00_22345 [Dactylosporangium sp. CS-047395]|uniref:hypothetical protein n=1 Tax=Dactylosporangium sp. CS-047395 TaxID=3239936 RepID=UPI003D94736C